MQVFKYFDGGKMAVNFGLVARRYIVEPTHLNTTPGIRRQRPKSAVPEHSINGQATIAKFPRAKWMWSGRMDNG